MKTALRILLGLLGIIVFVMLVGVFLPKKITVERSIEINAPIDQVFTYVATLEEFHNWSPWNAYDENIVITYEGESGKVGSRYIWKGNNNVGEGFQEIISLKSNERIDLDLVFTAPWEAESDVYYTFQGDTKSTTLLWGIYSEYKYPMNIMIAAMGMRSTLGQEFDLGLNMLKEILESLPPEETEPSDALEMEESEASV